MRSEWITCTTCEEEFRVVSDALLNPEYCPFCGSLIEHLEDEEEE